MVFHHFILPQLCSRGKYHCWGHGHQAWRQVCWPGQLWSFNLVDRSSRAGLRSDWCDSRACKLKYHNHFKKRKSYLLVQIKYRTNCSSCNLLYNTWAYICLLAFIRIIVQVLDVILETKNWKEKDVLFCIFSFWFGLFEMWFLCLSYNKPCRDQGRMSVYMWKKRSTGYRND